MADQTGGISNRGLGGGRFGCGFLCAGVAKNFGDGAREIVDAAGESSNTGFLAVFDKSREFLNGILGSLVERDFRLQ